MILSRFIFLYSILVNFIISPLFLPDRFPLKIILIKNKGEKKKKYFVSSFCFFYVVGFFSPASKIIEKKNENHVSRLSLPPPFPAVLAYFLSHFFPLFCTDILFWCCSAFGILSFSASCCWEEQSRGILVLGVTLVRLLLCTNVYVSIE